MTALLSDDLFSLHQLPVPMVLTPVHHDNAVESKLARLTHALLAVSDELQLTVTSSIPAQNRRDAESRS